MLSLALVIQPGAYPTGAWRLPGNEMERALDASFYIELAQRAEAGGFDALFHADKLNLPPDPWDHLLSPLEPVTLLAAIASHTERIGLVATASTTYSEPYNLTRSFATLDHLSRGRAAWNVVTTGLQQAADNFGNVLPEHAKRYERAAEFIEVFKALCLSWSPDAIVIDRETGVQTRIDLIRPIDHVGRHFVVKGPLDTPRPPQGYPVLFQAGQSRDGLEVACRHSEVLFGVQNDIEVAKAFYRSTKELVASFGRNPDHFKIMPGVITVLGSTDEEAHRLYDDLREAAGGMENADMISSVLGFDLMAADPEEIIDLERVQKAEDSKGTQSWHALIYGEVSRHGAITVRQARAIFERIGRSGHLQIVGTPEHIADVLETWYREKATDSFALQPAPMPTGAYDFFDQVMPILVERGVVPADNPGTTLRERLGLPTPV